MHTFLRRTITLLAVFLLTFTVVGAGTASAEIAPGGPATTAPGGPATTAVTSDGIATTLNGAKTGMQTAFIPILLISIMVMAIGFAWAWYTGKWARVIGGAGGLIVFDWMMFSPEHFAAIAAWISQLFPF